MTATHGPSGSRRIDQRLRDAGLFFQEFFRTFRDTGSVIPSAPALCNALTRYVDRRDDPDAPLDILEVGAGTGPVSTAIARKMAGKDTLELVESNERFVERLRALLEEDPDLSRVADRTTLHHCRVTELDRTERFDVIVSGLPFANFTAGEVREIFEFYLDVLRPGGHLSFYGYLGTKQIKAVFAPRAAYLQQARSSWVVEEYVAGYGVDEERIFANIPPAWIFHLRKPA